MDGSILPDNTTTMGLSVHSPSFRQFHIMTADETINPKASA